MRALRTGVVLSSLLIAAGAVAGTEADKKAGSTTTTTAAAAAPTTGSTGSAAAPPAAGTPAPDVDPSTVKPEDMPTPVRMRRLEQKTQALKERAWQLKARVQMLKEQMLGGGVGAQALISHGNEMGSSFHLTNLSYTLDGTVVFVRSDEGAESLYKTKTFDIFSGPISPGSHNLSVTATYRGHGYGVFEYLSKFTFTAKSSTSFNAGEGKITKVDCRGYEKGGASTAMEKRPAVDCKVSEVSPEKPAQAGAPATPGTTPLPAPTTTSPSPSPTTPTTNPGK